MIISLTQCRRNILKSVTIKFGTWLGGRMIGKFYQKTTPMDDMYI